MNLKGMKNSNHRQNKKRTFNLQLNAYSPSHAVRKHPASNQIQRISSSALQIQCSLTQIIYVMSDGFV